MTKYLPFIVAALIITAFSAAFTVKESMQALVVQFGEIKGEPITKAGLHFKLPFIQDVRYFDKRILSWDGTTAVWEGQAIDPAQWER